MIIMSRPSRESGISKRRRSSTWWTLNRPARDSAEAGHWITTISALYADQVGAKLEAKADAVRIGKSVGELLVAAVILHIFVILLSVTLGFARSKKWT